MRAWLTSADPEPPAGTRVRDDCGIPWINTGHYPAAWVHEKGESDCETWVKIAGNYGPVIVLQ